jgi:hypothetical protein
MAKLPNHLHKYKKVNLGQNGKEYLVYRCMKPACSHYIPLHLAEGKLCECNRCGEPMIITKIVLNTSGGKPTTFPHCPDCLKPKKEKNPDVEALAEFLKDKAV